LHKGNLSPNTTRKTQLIFVKLQARFCKLYPADFPVAIYLLWCSLRSWICCVLFSSKSPLGIFPNRVGRLFGSEKNRGFDAKTHPKKAPEHYVQVQRFLISIFRKSRVYLDYSISTDKIGKIELAESSLQIRA